MRIVHVLHSRGYGGAENHALVLMKGQRAAGHDVSFAGLRDSWLGRACAAADIPVCDIRMAGVYDLWSAWRLRQHLRHWRADIVHGHLIRGARYAGWVGHRHRAPLAICTAHATTARTHMRGCAHIIAVSEAVRVAVLSAGYAPERVSTIWNGMPDVPQTSLTTKQRTALRSELGLPADRYIWVNTGRFNRDKAQDLLVSAWLALPASARQGMALALIGAADNPYGQALRDRLRPEDHVHFLGYRSDVPRLLPAFDAYALSSRREALGLSVIEAMAASLPVLATHVGGVPEVVQDGVTGLLVAPDEPQVLAAGMLTMSAAPERALAMGQAGRARYLAHFTDQAMVQATLALYARLGPR